ncbi:hypothetical protein AAE478_003692 [Parahypoxylon ruwenzoriense]
MADPIFLLPTVLKQTAQVANNFGKYMKNVKDAPKMVRTIILEVNKLTGVLNTLAITLEAAQVPTSKQWLLDSLKQCQSTLGDLEKLVIPEEADESTSPNTQPPQRSSICNFNFRGSSFTQTQTQTNRPEIWLSRLRTGSPNTSQPNPVRAHSPTANRPSMSTSERLKWPLFQQKKAESLLKLLERHTSQLSLAMETDNAMNLNAIKVTVQDIEANMNDDEKRRVLTWLRPKNIDMYDFHHEQQNKQEDETCDWLIKSRGWRQWLEGGSAEPDGYRRFLWIYGIPGAGKTVLASFLVDDIRKFCQASGCSFYYCSHERNQDETMPLLRWIVGDLSRQVKRFIPKELEDLRQSGDFNIQSLLNCFLVISRQFLREGRRVYVVVDAVDESRMPRGRLLDALIKIGRDPAFGNVSLLMTSREEQDIRDAMTSTENAGEPPHMNGLRNPDNCPDISAPYTSLTMSNSEVMQAIRVYVKKQFARNSKFKMWPPDFRKWVENELARNARGMFRWVSCQIDIIERRYIDKDGVVEALNNLPDTLFDTYARILGSIKPEVREFARTALALICSNTSNVKSADVLLQASLHNVRHGVTHTYTVRVLGEILGCLIKITDLKRKPYSIYQRDDEEPLQKVSVAHYTVKEFLFEKSKQNDGPRPAGDFALSDTGTRALEMQVVFNGLQKWGTNRPMNSKNPTRYEEHCLKMSDWALKRGRRSAIVGNQQIWESVVPCLSPRRLYIRILRTARLRAEFPEWGKLFAIDELPPDVQAQSKRQREPRIQTGILASLILLSWPEFADKYLKSAFFTVLSARAKQAVWSDRFTVDLTADQPQRSASTVEKGTPVTLLRLCVLWKCLDFLELFVQAGASFDHEPDIIYLALQNPYDNRFVDGDGTVTGQLLKILLENGADPHPPGYKYTPLQYAVYHLEDGWVQSLLLEGRDPNSVGDPKGKHPHGSTAVKPWHNQHPLEICREATWRNTDGKGWEEQIEKSRKQVAKLLIQYGAREAPANSPVFIDLV